MHLHFGLDNPYATHSQSNISKTLINYVEARLFVEVSWNKVMEIFFQLVIGYFISDSTKRIVDINAFQPLGAYMKLSGQGNKLSNPIVKFSLRLLDIHLPKILGGRQETWKFIWVNLKPTKGA